MGQIDHPTLDEAWSRRGIRADAPTMLEVWAEATSEAMQRSALTVGEARSAEIGLGAIVEINEKLYAVNDLFQIYFASPDVARF